MNRVMVDNVGDMVVIGVGVDRSCPRVRGTS